MVKKRQTPIESFKHLLFNCSLQIDYLVERYENHDFLTRVDAILNSLCNSLNHQGKIIFVGCGKSFKVAKKNVSMLQSLGIPSTCLHPTEALHGDIGSIKNNDSLIFCSTSGETDEIIMFLRYLQNIESTSHDYTILSTNKIAVCSTSTSTMSTLCDHVLLVPQRFVEENIQDGLKAPTLSTTSMLILLDCLCMALGNAYYENDLYRRNLHFSRCHPAGGIGKRTNLQTSTIASDQESITPLSVARIRPSMGELQILQTLLLNDMVQLGQTFQLPSKIVQLHYKEWFAQSAVRNTTSFYNYLNTKYDIEMPTEDELLINNKQ